MPHKAHMHSDLRYVVQSNALEVEVGFYVDNGLIVLPAGLPGFEHCGAVDKGQIAENDHGSCLILNCPVLQVQLRTNDYFMGKTTPTHSERRSHVYVRNVIECEHAVWGRGKL